MPRPEPERGERSGEPAALWVVGPAERAREAALAERLGALGFAVRSVAGSAGLAQSLAETAPRSAADAAAAPGAGAARAPAGIFLDLALADRALEASLRLLAPHLDSGEGTAIAFGPERPEPARRRRLAEAGVALGLFGETDDAALRFQANRAFLRLRPRGRARRDLRAPGRGLVRVRGGGREKSARPYSLSTGGAFLETPRPSLRGARVELELDLAEACARPALRAEVVHTNVPGNLRRPGLPAGMGVRFEDAGAAREALEAEVHARSAALVL